MLSVTVFPFMIILASSKWNPFWIILGKIVDAANLYRPKIPYAGLKNILVNDLVSHMMFGSNLNVHAEPERLRPPWDAVGI
jgi:hypothetical protein